MSISEDFSTKETNLAVGEFYGMRKWQIIPATMDLVPMSVDNYIWTPGVNESKHFDPGSFVRKTPATTIDHPPLLKCQCGFYAYFDPTGDYSGWGNLPKITGVIKAWGKMVIGPLGFRAQYAEIVALCLPEMVAYFDPTILRIQDKYRVPILPNRAAMLDKFPLSESPVKTKQITVGDIIAKYCEDHHNTYFPAVKAFPSATKFNTYRDKDGRLWALPYGLKPELVDQALRNNNADIPPF